jgi:hypothetical protein
MEHASPVSQRYAVWNEERMRVLKTFARVRKTRPAATPRVLARDVNTEDGTTELTAQ